MEMKDSSKHFSENYYYSDDSSEFEFQALQEFNEKILDVREGK